MPCVTRNCWQTRQLRGPWPRYGAIRDDLSLPLFEVTDAIAALDWDLDHIKLLHQRLNQAMKREVEHLLTLGDRHATMNDEVVG